MRKVIMESPYAGDVKTNKLYAARCLADCVKRGESPYASHLLLTNILNDDVEPERVWGISAGHAWTEIADAVVVYTDLGISSGMKKGIEAAEAFGKPLEYRSIEFSIPKPPWPRIISKDFKSVGEISEILRGAASPVQFVDCDFSDLDIRSLNFDNCVFDACKMVKTKLGSAVKAEFYSVDMRHIDLSWADVRWAYAINCPADHAKVIGCQLTIDCDFMAGLIGKEEDGWRLIKWAMLVLSPAAEIVWAVIPKRYHMLLRLQEGKAQPRTRISQEVIRKK